MSRGSLERLIRASHMTWTAIEPCLVCGTQHARLSRYHFSNKRSHMSGGFYLFCSPSKEGLRSPPHLVLISFLTLWHFFTMIGLVFQFWKVGHQQALLLLQCVWRLRRHTGCHDFMVQYSSGWVVSCRGGVWSRSDLVLDLVSFYLTLSAICLFPCLLVLILLYIVLALAVLCWT